MFAKRNKTRTMSSYGSGLSVGISVDSERNGRRWWCRKVNTKEDLTSASKDQVLLLQTNNEKCVMRRHQFCSSPTTRPRMQRTRLQMTKKNPWSSHMSNNFGKAWVHGSAIRASPIHAACYRSFVVWTSEDVVLFNSLVSFAVFFSLLYPEHILSSLFPLSIFIQIKVKNKQYFNIIF